MIMIGLQIPEEFVAVIQLLCCPGGPPPKLITAWPIARLKTRLSNRALNDINDCLYTKRSINAAFASFLSYPRHEYFRRVLCDLLGKDVENGELPNDLDLIGNMVRDICYNNAVNYFNM